MNVRDLIDHLSDMNPDHEVMYPAGYNGERETVNWIDVEEVVLVGGDDSLSEEAVVLGA